MFVNRDVSISDSFSCLHAKLSGRVWVWPKLTCSGMEFAYSVFSLSCWLKCEKDEDPTV